MKKSDSKQLCLATASILGLATRLSIILLLTFAWQITFALSTDNDQPIEIEADSAELDEIKNVSIYRGNVIVTRGSIRMTGDKMTVYNTEDDDLEILIMEGRPATYRQLPDDSSVYNEAEALRMEHYELKDLVILIDEALVTQENLRFSGKRIEYDTLNSRVKAWSSPKDKQSAGASTTSGKKQRVKIIIKPKNKEK